MQPPSLSARNSGTIEATATGKRRGRKTRQARPRWADNTGQISGESVAINANSVVVTGNTGLIQATGAGGGAIFGGSVDIHNSTGGHIEALLPRGTAIGAKPCCHGRETRDRSQADVSGIFRDAVTVSANSGRIEATGASGRAIDATARTSGAATVNNTAARHHPGGRGRRSGDQKRPLVPLSTNAELHYSAGKFPIDAKHGQCQL